MYFYFFAFLICLICRMINVKKIKKYSHIFTLQVQGCMIKTRYPKKNKGKSTFLLSPLRGSMTLEAALVLPIFIFAVICLFYFFIYINYQNIVQNSVDNAAKSIARNRYVMNRIAEFTEKDAEESGFEIDEDLLTNGINIGYTWKKITDDEVKKYTKGANVLLGMSGISVTSSNVRNNTNGINDLKVTYRVYINILGNQKFKLTLGNRCYFRNWIGESISEQVNVKRQTVYITRTGSVYHLDKRCTYINLSVTGTPYDNIDNLRNSSGSKYSYCTRCAKRKLQPDDTVYVTMCGSNYHCDKSCSSIIRDVIEIDISEVGSRKLCSRCAKNSN